MFIIMLNGHVACLKTTIARRLSDLLKAPLLETNKFGSVIGESRLMDDSRRINRYKMLYKLADSILADGYSLILDGTFIYRGWRKPVYDLCKKYSIKDIVIVRCYSTDENAIKRRLLFRKSDKFNPERGVVYFKNYLQSVSQDEPPYSDVLCDGYQPGIVEIDSSSGAISVISGKGELIDVVVESLRLIVPALREVILSASR